MISNDEKLNKCLDELAEEYKELLFETLVSRSDSIYEINTLELLKLDSEIKKPLFEGYDRLKKRRKQFMSIGFIYLFMGLCLLLMYFFIINRHYYNSYDVILLMALVISMTGLFTIFMPFLFPISNRSSIKSHKNSIAESRKMLEYKAISLWRNLESIFFDLIENNTKTVSHNAIVYLYENKMINDTEQKTLKKLLIVRNSVVHSTNDNFSDVEIYDIINDSSHIIDRLKKNL